MAAGLQVWNAAGNLVVDTSTQMGRIFGNITVASGDSGSLSDARFSSGTPFAVPIMLYSTADWEPDNTDAGLGWPVISFSGTTMSWSSYDSFLTDQPDFIIYYGAY